MATRAVPALLAAALLPGLAGCAAETARVCTVRHEYAIVVFQDGFGNVAQRFITSFRLNVRYGSVTTSRMISARIALGSGNGGNPQIIIRTYYVGWATGCWVDQVRAHQG